MKLSPNEWQETKYQENSFSEPAHAVRDISIQGYYPT